MGPFPTAFAFAPPEVMAAAALRQELTCLSVYTDPVTLPSGHSFCQICIEGALDSQLSCPECRQIVRRKTKLKRNLTLCNITKQVTSTEPEKRVKVDVPCTYCDHHVPAAKTCVLCEASLCDKHLLKHTKSSEHVLIDPTDFPEKRKCHIHEKILQYYCPEDDTCICVSCCLVGDHRGHQVKSLSEASEEKKNHLKTTLDILTADRKETKESIRHLCIMKESVQEDAVDMPVRLKALMTDFRRRLEILELQVLGEMSKQVELVSHDLTNEIQLQETESEELSMRINLIEDICRMTDPLAVLQQEVSDETEDCEDDTKSEDLYDDYIDVGLLVTTLNSGLAEIGTAVMNWHKVSYAGKFLDVNVASDLFLNRNTACNNVAVSSNLKMVSQRSIHDESGETHITFQNAPQVLSTTGVSSGRHYYALEACVPGYWRLGLVYPTMERNGEDQAIIGYNDKSWGLERWNDQFSSVHNGKIIKQSLDTTTSPGVWRVGAVSFRLCMMPLDFLH
uniref:Uncharacterized protein n=2 Tax=Leptobrachium leishanense TaxID=445787 RepID=A0A8C5MH47_9ANUR